MVATLGKEYYPTVIEFLSMHCGKICESLQLAKSDPMSDETKQSIYLVRSVLQDRTWAKRDQESYKAISSEMNKIFEGLGRVAR